MALYAPQPQALAVLYADVERHALGQREVFVGTGGSVVERSNAREFRFYAHQYYDGEGKQRERYLAGPIGGPSADEQAAALRARIRELKALVPTLRMLGREGFQLADPRTFATVASLHNHGLFAAGGLLIGSHAYGILLNRIGVRAAGYATEDVDLARKTRLALNSAPDADLLSILRASGLNFVAVPSLDRKQASTSFKLAGRSRFVVDLLVPSRDETFPTVAVPELKAHATALPYLGYLLAESQPAMLMAREGCCAVRVPLPERFAVHKLLVSRLRSGGQAKAHKDLQQAAVLCAALAESQSGAIAEAVAKVPARARRYLAPALAAVRRILSDHPRALEELGIAAH